MRGLKPAADPLWECLCPSWGAAILQGRRFLTQRPRPGNTTKSHPETHQTRTLSASSASKLAAKSRERLDSQSCRSRQPVRKHFSTSICQQSFGRMFETKHKLKAMKPAPVPLRDQSVATLYARLDDLAQKDEVDTCREIVHELVRERGEAPSIGLYNALIASNTCPRTGAAWRVHNLLQELEDEGMEPDQVTCHNVLKVLAIHPDNLLCTDIQRYMRDKWLPLTPEGHHHVTVGLLRQGCFEMALDSLEDMTRKGIKPEAWLLNMFAYMLSEAGELDVIYQMIRGRCENTETGISPVLWTWLLDVASAARHHALTDFVWRTQVEPGYMQASSGICINALSTASGAGDPTLATEVIRHLSNRGDKPDELHYQLLIDAYMNSVTPYLDEALTVLAVMATEKLRPTAFHTRSLSMYFSKTAEAVPEALDKLHRLHAGGKTIPLAALHLVIESYGNQKNQEEALKVYKQMHTFNRNPEKAFVTTETFNVLLRAIRERDDGPKHAGFVISEMLALRVQPDALTYDRLILIFTQAADSALSRESDDHRQHTLECIDLACRYFNEIQSLNWRPRWRTLTQLMLSLAANGDGRWMDLMQFADNNAVEGDGWAEQVPGVRKKVERACASYRSRFLPAMDEQDAQVQSDGWHEIRPELQQPVGVAAA